MPKAQVNGADFKQHAGIKMKTISAEHVILITIMETMLKKKIIDKEDLVQMRAFSMSVLASFAESPNSKVVRSAYDTSRDVDLFFESFLRAFK